MTERDIFLWAKQAWAGAVEGAWDSESYYWLLVQLSLKELMGEWELEPE